MKGIPAGPHARLDPLVSVWAVLVEGTSKLSHFDFALGPLLSGPRDARRASTASRGKRRMVLGGGVRLVPRPLSLQSYQGRGGRVIKPCVESSFEHSHRFGNNLFLLPAEKAWSKRVELVGGFVAAVRISGHVGFGMCVG